MNTPELPDPVFDDGDHLPPEVELPELADPTPNPLFDNLVPLTPVNRLPGRMSFTDAMPEMGMSSVFDIIRQPKAEFTRQLRTLSDADGDLAYNNALCYATQIARSYREDAVSSGRNLPLIAPQTGVRALVNIGPSYPNLFKENWDQFCKVGAIEAMDGPVAYLGSLRRFAQQKIEGASTSPLRIPLAVRRPDLDSLVIDEQSTYQSRPMLDLVNDVLSQGIAKYQTQKGDARPIHQLLAEKKHPFVFPYHFAHQQVSLALSGEKPTLGELNYKLNDNLARTNAWTNLAQVALTGLNPVLQKMVQAPSLFSHAYVGLSRLLDDKRLYLPGLEALRHLPVGSSGFLLRDQSGISNVTPPATELIQSQGTDPTIAALVFSQPGKPDKQLILHLYSQDGPAAYFRVMNHHVITSGSNSKALQLRYLGDAPSLQDAAGYQCTVIVEGRAVRNLETSRHQTKVVAQWKVTFTPEDDYALTPEQVLFFQEHFGLSFTHTSFNPLTALNTFTNSTSLEAKEVEHLLAVNRYAPVGSPNYRTANRVVHGSSSLKPFPRSNHFGACYVNGMGGLDSGTVNYNYHDNTIGLTQMEGNGSWHLTNTSLERWDRLQRMVRLQRNVGLTFDQLDTLLISAIRSEGDANLDQQINLNTLRTLGTFRFFNRHYGIDVDAFAAFVYHVSPYAITGQTPLLDKVFNTPVLFDRPLVIDDGGFNLNSSDPLHQKTVAQLCASLGVQPGQEFERLVADTLTAVTPLKRSLAVVSSLYRQARIAQMFGLSASEFWELTTLLGGSAYRGSIASGRLKALDSAGKDILDILMELDWAVRWLKANKLTVTGLLALLSTDAAQEPGNALLERLQQMADEGRASTVNAATVSALGLPNKATGAAIDWHMELGKGTSAIIDAAGLVKALQPTLTDTDQQQLAEKVRSLVAALGLAANDVQIAEDTLNTYLANALSRQQRLVEGLLQEHTTLLPELAVWVAQCADVSPYRLLERTFQAWPINAEPDAAKVSAVLADLRQIGTCARAVSWAKVGTAALRTFVVNPAWLGCDSLWPLSLNTLHLLKAYDSLFNTLGQPEERLLGYVQQANALVSRRPGKRQLAVQSQTCNAALASLLGWSEREVAVLTALLPQQTAKTVAHIDWVRRAQALSLETGLNAATLLKACSLHANSPEADWQAVGQAAMAAVNR
ncbi:Toxin subunit YenA1 [Pseudomonas sp. MM227]|uniref:Tc toxin subunit A n=1 Tax=Pseudomonas sp. MM227 TaxID=3019968 RepID=UPI00221E61DC|nr:Tc toxin subunit A [Pseudomonas sp. MM227]CAI3787365.1 Toxin subunit YenA1 [Pseudomonas sp. MM227]